MLLVTGRNSGGVVWRAYRLKEGLAVVLHSLREQTVLQGKAVTYISPPHTWRWPRLI